MKKIISLVSALLVSASSIADISSPEVQQALHDVVAAADGFASDHVFTCQDRQLVRCDTSNNIIRLSSYISDASQLDADLSVLTHLEHYSLYAEINVTKLPVGLDNLTMLWRVDIDADNFTLPVIDGNAFPVSINSLAIAAPQNAISLTNWQLHDLTSLRLSASDVNFNNMALPNVKSIALAQSTSISNVNYAGFTSLTNFSWQRLSVDDIAAYYAYRAQFPLLSSEVVELDLNRQHKEPILTEIPSYVLNIANLQSLKITGHAITELPAQLFAMPALKHLDVGFNEISTLPAIDENSKLEYLSLKSNRLTQIPNELFKLSKLRHLDVYANKISSLPAELFLMPSLQELDAGNNLIQNVAAMSVDSTVQSLGLQANKLTEVPVELFQLENLLTLKLGSNELTTLPEISSGNSALQTLNLNGNKINTLPVGLFNYLPLQDLQMLNNALVNLPVGIVNSSLESVNFTGNNFLQVPDELSLFTGLKNAYFDRNQISTLAEQWKQSTSLKQLWLSQNQLKALTPEMLNNLPASLTLLELSSNQMVGELPAFTKVNPALLVGISSNALWSTDTNVLQQYGNSRVLQGQLLPVRGIKVIEKDVKGKLVSYIQWGFPLMQDVLDRTSGYHASNGAMLSGRLLEGHFTEANPGPYISTGYRLVIEYTQGKKAGKIVKKTFSCFYLLAPLLCNLDKFSSSYDEGTYNSSVFSYGINGSLAGAKITVFSTSGSLSSSPTYWASTEKHEQFVNELEYDEAELPAPDPLAGSIYYYHLLVLLVMGFVRVRRSNNAGKKSAA